MPSSSSSTPSSCSRSRRPRSSERRRRPARAAALALALSLTGLLASGCGDDTSSSQPESAATPEAGGTLHIAVQGRVKEIDPLFADDRGERLVARQIFEPLIASQSGPFGQTRRLPGLVRRLEPHRGDTLWTARLRPGVLFSDGEILDGDAVKANAERWMSVGDGPQLVGDLNFVDLPRPGVVRFFLTDPDPRFGRTLAQARLGVIAPAAITAATGGPVKPTSPGTGPFELRENDAQGTLLARNAGWWGSTLGLGPGVDQVEVSGAGRPALRAEDLESGQIQVADDLDKGAARAVNDNPLLVTVRGRDGTVGVDRSVRGIDVAAADQPLADVWLTTLR